MVVFNVGHGSYSISRHICRSAARTLIRYIFFGKLIYRAESHREDRSKDFSILLIKLSCISLPLILSSDFCRPTVCNTQLANAIVIDVWLPWVMEMLKLLLVFRFQMKFYYICQLGYWLHVIPELYFQKTKKVSKQSVWERTACIENYIHASCYCDRTDFPFQWLCLLNFYFTEIQWRHDNRRSLFLDAHTWNCSRG